MPLLPSDAYRGPWASGYPNTRAGKRAFRKAYFDYNQTRSGWKDEWEDEYPPELGAAMMNPGHLYDEEMDDEWNPEGPFNPVYDALMQAGDPSMLDEFEDEEADEMGYDYDDEEFGGRRSRYARLATRYTRSMQRGKERRAERLMSRMERIWSKMRPLKKVGLDSPDTVAAKAEGVTSSMEQSFAPAPTTVVTSRPARRSRRRGTRGRSRSVWRPGGVHPVHNRGQRRMMRRKQRTDPRYFADQQAMEQQLSQSMPAYMGGLEMDLDDELAAVDAELEMYGDEMEMYGDDMIDPDGYSFNMHEDEDDDYGGDDLDEDDEMGILGLGRRERYARLSTRYGKLSMRGKTRRMARVMSRMQKLWSKLKPMKKAGLQSPAQVLAKSNRSVRAAEGKLVDYIQPAYAPQVQKARMYPGGGVSPWSYSGKRAHMHKQRMSGKKEHMRKQHAKRRAKIRASRN